MRFGERNRHAYPRSIRDDDDDDEIHRLFRMATTGVLLLQLLLLEKATNATTTPTTLNRGRGGKRAQIQHDASQSVAFAVLAFELKKKRVPRAARRERERKTERRKQEQKRKKERTLNKRGQKSSSAKRPRSRRLERVQSLTLLFLSFIKNRHKICNPKFDNLSVTPSVRFNVCVIYYTRRQVGIRRRCFLPLPRRSDRRSRSSRCCFSSASPRLHPPPGFLRR